MIQTGRIVRSVRMACALAAIASLDVEAQSKPSARAREGLPFGPWRLPDAEMREPFTGTVLALHPHDARRRLEAARRANFRVFVILNRARRHHQNPDKSFSLELWKAEIDRYRWFDFAPYVADGTILGHLLTDEPHDPTNWNGKPTPYSVIEAMAAHSKSLWPTMPVGVGSPATFLQGGAPWKSLDWAFSQYRPKKGEIHQWLAREVQAAKQAGLELILSMQVLVGGVTGGPLPPAQLRTFGSILAREPHACALTMWKYDDKDPTYFEDRAVRAAVADIGRIARARKARSCARPSPGP